MISLAFMNDYISWFIFFSFSFLFFLRRGVGGVDRYGTEEPDIDVQYCTIQYENPLSILTLISNIQSKHRFYLISIGPNC